MWLLRLYKIYILSRPATKDLFLLKVVKVQCRYAIYQQIKLYRWFVPIEII